MRYLPVDQNASPASPPISVLGFGCAGLLGRASRRQSEQAVGAALDHGITLFDTARSYGYGESEGLLGSMFQGRRDQVFLCTKFGILPTQQGGWKQKLKPLARAAIQLVPALRKTVQRGAGGQLVHGQFSVGNLHSSLETSLRALRTDYLDMLLLHAAPESTLAQDDLLEALERLVDAGKVRMAGISAEQPVIAAYFEQRPAVLRTAQFALNLQSLDFAASTRKHADLLLIANHPYGGAGGNPAAQVARLRALVPGELRYKMTEVDPQVLPEVVLNLILNGTGVQAVIPAMMQVRHIESNVKAIEHCRFTAEELALMLGLLTGAQKPGGEKA